MRLSAALIVRNEATEIYQCLNSLRGIDEIVIVDTGSVDDTLREVQLWADKNPETVVRIEHFTWIDDFSAARNYASTFCTGDWILSMDADCRMAALAIPALRRGLAHVKGDRANIWQHAKGGPSRNIRTRVYKPGVLFTGKIHENLPPTEETLTDVVMLYGWSESHKHDPDRNLRILSSLAAEEPNGRNCYYLGSEYNDRNRPDDAIPWLLKATVVTQWRPERADAHLLLARIYWHKSEGDLARQHCLASLANVPECREALRLMAEMSFPEQAVTWNRFADIATNEGCLFVRCP